jgi:5'-nucleotidase
VKRIQLILAFSLLFGSLSTWAGKPNPEPSVAPKTLTIFHTNDLHSHFRPNPQPPFLGGVARLKTLVQRLRREHPHSLLIDGGDWAEGHVYYLADAGAASIQIMEEIGYDAAVVGNHDWMNGPDQLLNALQVANERVKYVSANLDFDDYSRKRELMEKVLPYSIHEVNGIRVGVIGLSTFELIYDQYFQPVKITEPFLRTRRLAARLKKGAKQTLWSSRATTTSG